ncbi:MAG TPA: PQQ-binding-like beta-propeller repeat protein [Acidimicrobiia bacterium]|nr:PQQ-binding-like beta-propeller repeat protein [Acidimicrobiia bacterium]
MRFFRVTPRNPRPRRRRLVVAAVVAVLLPALFVAREVVDVRRLGTPVRQVTSTAAPPAPLVPGDTGVRWTVKADGRISDAEVLPKLGLVIYVEHVAQRSWRASALDAHTGTLRWSHTRSRTDRIEAWAVTDAAVVLAYHHSDSRLAWRTHKGASLVGLDPLSGKVLWVRHVYTLRGERPGDYAPTLASPSENVVYARTEFGVPNAIDTETGETLWEHPGLNDCRAHEIVAGPAGVAMSQRCPRGRERIFLLDPRTGETRWKLVINTPSLRLLAVGSDSVVLYQGGMVEQVIALGPTGGFVSQTPCACGDGESLQAGVAGETVLVGGGPFGLLGVDGTTGAVRWQRPVDGGPVHRVLTHDGDAHIVGGDGALIRVDPADGAGRVLVPGTGGELDPAAIVAPAGGYLAAGSARGFAFTALR